MAPAVPEHTSRMELISAEARQIRFGRGLLAAVGALIYGTGWALSKVTLGAAWTVAAFRLGWREARE
ncbi:hypothetical protein AB0I72_19235 [Nocardiopsis sp. NPDC049922]|uniref:hypothetical protein n=1 Tax=Nocardiopsis sp. NPDC049922 TaxID=3155157 RepID=UPI0033E349FB